MTQSLGPYYMAVSVTCFGPCLTSWCSPTTWNQSQSHASVCIVSTVIQTGSTTVLKKEDWCSMVHPAVVTSRDKTGRPICLWVTTPVANVCQAVWCLPNIMLAVSLGRLASRISGDTRTSAISLWLCSQGYPRCPQKSTIMKDKRNITLHKRQRAVDSIFQENTSHQSQITCLVFCIQILINSRAGPSFKSKKMPRKIISIQYHYLNHSGVVSKQLLK